MLRSRVRSMAPAARLLAVAVLVVVSAAAPGAVGDGEGAGAAIVPEDAAVELDGPDFDAFLGAAREPFAVVEFFVYWGRACRNYKPHYEKVAKLFNGPDAAHPGTVLMTRIQCTSKVNIDLCNRFSVYQYPFLLWGPTTKFVNATWDRRQEKSEIKVIDDGRTAERLLDWINSQMESSFTLNDKKCENKNYASEDASYLEQVVRAISDVKE